MSEFDGGGGDGGGITIAGKKIPTWALLLGAGGLIFLVLQNKGSGETTQTDTGTGLLAAELDQRLNEFWEAIKASLEDKGSIKCGVGFHLDADGKTCVQDTPGGCPSGYTLQDGVCKPPVGNCPSGYTLQNGVCQPPTGSCPPGYTMKLGICVPDIQEWTICESGTHWNGSMCEPDQTPTPNPNPPTPEYCQAGYYWNGVDCAPFTPPVVEPPPYTPPPPGTPYTPYYPPMPNEGNCYGQSTLCQDGEPRDPVTCECPG